MNKTRVSTFVLFRLFVMAAGGFLFGAASAQAVSIDAVYFAQTHVLQATNEYFRLVGNRSTLLKVQVTDPATPTAPAVTATLSLADGSQTNLTLSGPATLPDSFDDYPGRVQHSFTNSFTAMIPKEWIKPGLDVTVNAGDQQESILDVNVGAPIKMVVLQPVVQLFSELDMDIPDAAWDEWSEDMPFAEVEVRKIPPVLVEEFLALPYRSDRPVARIRSINPYQGDVLNQLNQLARHLQVVNGSRRIFSTCLLSNQAKSGFLGRGGDYSAALKVTSAYKVMPHEMGHAFNLNHATRNDGYPYWGDMYGIPSSSSNYAHAGPTWVFDSRGPTFIEPTTQPGNVGNVMVGLYKSDPMRGGGSGGQNAGRYFRYYSDWSVKRMMGYIEARTPVWNETEQAYFKWNEADRACSDSFDIPLLVEHDVSVYSLLSLANKENQDLCLVYPPFGSYTGNLLRVFDPRDPQDQADARTALGDCDYTLRVIQGGAESFYMIKGHNDGQKSYVLRGGVNVPASDGEVSVLELLYTPNAQYNGLPDSPKILYAWSAQLPAQASFLTPPTADSTLPTITMSASAVQTDAPGNVEYRFTETSGNWGGTSSGWISESTYTDTGLLPGVTYSYTVEMRDANQTSSASALLSAQTSTATPVVVIDSPAIGRALLPEGVGLVLEASLFDLRTPSPGTLVPSWGVLSAPVGGSAVFADSTALDTTVTFSGSGEYVLRLTASNNTVQIYDEVSVIVSTSTGIFPGLGVNLERFDNISGLAVADLTNSAAFQNGQPDYTAVLSSLFETGTVGDNYGQRIRGYFIAPQTGNYTFYISSDDHSELRLSTDTNPVNQSVIARVDGWTNTHEWDKFSSQQSTPVSLVAGKAYYIEALHKEAGNADHLEVGVVFPGDSGVSPLSATHLALFEGSGVENQGPEISLTATGNGPITLDASVSDDGGSVVFLWTMVQGPGLAVFSDTEAEDPEVSFDAVGTYRLRLCASDGEIITFADVDVEVENAEVILTINEGIGGNVSPRGVVCVDPDAVTAILASPDAWYHFAYWAGETAGIADTNSAGTTIQTVSNQTITAVFERNNRHVGNYEEWKPLVFGEGANDPGTGPLDDANGDGRTNIVDYAFQINPMTPGDADGKLPQAQILDMDGSRYFGVRLRRIEGGAGDLVDSGYEIYGIRYRLECTGDLGASGSNQWTSGSTQMEMAGEPISHSNGVESVTVRLKTPIDDSTAPSQNFMRVQIDTLE